MHWEEIQKQQSEWWYSKEEDLLRDCPDISSRPLYFPPRYDIFLKFIGEKRGAKILDIGCGLGDFLIRLKERGFRDITGFDHSEIAVRFAQKRGLNVIQGSIDCDEDVAKLPKDNDIIIMGDILEHMFAPKRIILKAREILKPDGILIISVPNAGWFINGILLSFFPKHYKVSPAFGSWTHLNQYTFWLLTRQLELCGFRVEKSSGVTHCRYETRSKNLWGNASCIAMDLVFRISGLLAKIKASIFSPHIVMLARKDEALPIEEDYFMKD